MLCVFCFWTFRFPSILTYQEQLQMFLFESEYLQTRLAVPGGVSCYVAEFLVQFYNNFVVGSLILALLLGLFQLQTWQMLNRLSHPNVIFFLSFIPSIIAWSLVCYVSTKLSFIIAVMFAQYAVLLYQLCCSNAKKFVFTAFIVPLLYWICGPAFFVFVIYVAIKEYKLPLLSVGTIIYALVCLFLSTMFVPYPLYRFFFGIGFCHNITELPVLYIVLVLSVALLPFVANFMSMFIVQKNMSSLAQSLTGIVFLLVSFFGISMMINSREYEILEYDRLVRSQCWDDIIKKAKAKNPDTPLSVASLNLALAMKGQLNNATQFFQNGVQGAFPVFDKNVQTSIMTLEIYYYLGLVNSAQRLAFEAMEAIPDNNKSSRLLKRLVETNLINGKYEVARKYLLMLQNTVHYKKWAKNTLSLLNDENVINSHQEYGYLRRVHLVNDFLFSDDEIDKIMGQLLMQNKENVMAMQYLLLLPQLEGDQHKYQMYMNYVLSLKEGDIQQPNDSVR